MRTGPPLRHGSFAPSAHELGSKGSFGAELIVRAAEQPDTLDAGSPTACDLQDMVVLERLAFRTALSGIADECASAAVAIPDGTFHMRRYVSWVIARLRRALSRSIGGSALGSFELLQQGIERSIQDLLEIAGMNVRA